MKYLLLFCTGILSGCGSPLFPDKSVSLSDFIPVEEEDTPVIEVDPSSFRFAEENFPDECTWHPLTKVEDGDTIVVREDIRVRFVGVDTPETKHPSKPLQRGGLEASHFTKEALKGQTEVCLISDPEGDQIDTYGRTLAYVFTHDGYDLNAELLKNGLARGYFPFPFSRVDEFRYYQSQAKKSHLGLWK